MRKRDDLKKMIPKSVFKMGIKLPDVRTTAKSTPNLLDEEIIDENKCCDKSEALDDDIDDFNLDSFLNEADEIPKINLSDNPFIKEDKKLNSKGTVVMRQSFSKFGQASRDLWTVPRPSSSSQSSGLSRSVRSFDDIDHSYAIHAKSMAKRDRVRKELAVFLSMARIDDEDEQDSGHASGQLNQPYVLDDNVTLLPKRILGRNVECEEAENFYSMGVSKCFRCSQPVYPLEKIEPSPGQPYHPGCFMCSVCHTKLTLATFCKSLSSARDRQIYCKSHQPKQDKGVVCNYLTRKSAFPAFKLSWGTDTLRMKSAVSETSVQSRNT